MRIREADLDTSGNDSVKFWMMMRFKNRFFAHATNLPRECSA